ncbi:MAG: C40 family peptidase [Thermoleophilia bacterium]
MTKSPTKTSKFMPRPVVLGGMLLLVALLVPVHLAAADPAGNDPSAQAQQQVQSIESQLGDVRAQMDLLNRDLEQVVERHNTTKVQLDQLTMELADSRQSLDKARALHDSQERLIYDRLTAVYKSGDISMVSILFNSSSVSDFLEQAMYIAKINEQDTKLEEQFQDSADKIQTITDEIDLKRLRQLHLEQDLADQQGQVEAKIAERQNRIDQLDTQERDILAAEAARVKAEQDKAAAETAAMLKDLQITDGVQAQVVQDALQYLGTPYVWGGESPSGFDCSGLVKYVYGKHGVSLPHASSMQFQMGVPVPPDQLQPGDLVFFYGATAPQHVGMYIGQGKFIEAPNFGEVVKISTLRFDGDYSGARRYPLKPRTP